MKVSFRNNSFDAFNINKVQLTNNNQTKTIATVVKEDKPSVSFAGVSGITPAGAGGILGGVVAVAAAIKYRKNIGKSIIKLMRQFGYKQTYNNIKEDLHVKKLNNLKQFYLSTEEVMRPMGTMFMGSAKAKDKAINDLIKHLETNGWNIERIPAFNPPKTQDMAEFNKYCEEYGHNILIKTFSKGENLYKETGQKTAFIIRDLDTIGENNLCVNEILRTSEYFRENGCTWITDCNELQKIDSGLLRPGRMNDIIMLRPIQEDSKELWENYLISKHGAYETVVKGYEQTKPEKPVEEIHWALQDAIDKFPEQYRESSELYQKLKDTQYYPFKF